MRQEFRHSSAGYFCSLWDQLGSLTQLHSSGSGLGRAGKSMKASLTWLVPGCSSTWPLFVHMPNLSFLITWWSNFLYDNWPPGKKVPSNKGKHCRSLRAQPHFHCTCLVKTSHRTSLESEGGKCTRPLHQGKGKEFAALLILPQSGQPSLNSSLGLRLCYVLSLPLEFLFHDIDHKSVMWWAVSLTGTYGQRGQGMSWICWIHHCIPTAQGSASCIASSPQMFV